jgi:serine/threonine protein kinase
MSKIGHFEILSELSKSATGTVYKANDPQTSQTVALKAIELSAFGDRATDLEKCLLEEADATKVLSNPNLTPVYGAGQIDGRFCAAMEYIQGNSVATMLARKEGFSIWDLLDIGRQVCNALDHAHSHQVFHYSLEPAKIMCGWRGSRSGLRRFQRRKIHRADARRAIDFALHVARAGSRGGHRCPLKFIQSRSIVLRDGHRQQSLRRPGCRNCAPRYSR